MMSCTLRLIKSDLYRYSGNSEIKSFLFHFFYTPGFIYSFWLRLSQCDIRAVRYFSYFILKSKQSKFGIYISPKVKIGYGLYLGHGLSIVVNPTCIIGNNVNLSQFTSIGANSGVAANIGSNVYIGPNVSIVGDVKISDNVTIGAGSVVVKDIPSGICAAGVPSKMLGGSHPQYIHNQYIWD